jgi:hypothetical protein
MDCTVVIFLKGASDGHVFYNVSNEDASRLKTVWSTSVNSSKPAILLDIVFHSDMGETSVLLSEIAAITVKKN